MLVSVDCSLWTEREDYSQEVMMMEVGMKKRDYSSVRMRMVELVRDDIEMVHEQY